MPISQVVWTSGVSYSHACSFCNQYFYDTVGAIPAGAASGTSPVLIVARYEENAASVSFGAATGPTMDVLLSDGTTLSVPGVYQDTNGSLPRSNNAYIHAVSDPRLNLGGTLRSGVYLVDVLGGGDHSDGVVFAALLDLSLVPGQTAAINQNGVTGPVTGATNPMPFSMVSDPSPFFAVSVLVKRFVHTVSVGSSSAGWEDAGSFTGPGASTGGTCAVATYSPTTPATLSAAWTSGDASGVWWATEFTLGELLGTSSVKHGRSYAQVIGD